MSFTSKHRNLRADGGRGFPIDPGADVEAMFADVVADALRRDFGGSPSKVKHLSRLTGANERTVQNWLQARNGPSGAGLVVLMRHSDAVVEAVLRMAGRSEIGRVTDLAKLRRDLAPAVAALSRWLEGG